MANTNTKVSPVSPRVPFGETADGVLVYFTQAGFQQFVAIQEETDRDGGLVGAAETVTLTNKTIDGDDNTLQDIATGSLKTRTGVDSAVVTGTAGAASSLSMFNGDGDVVDAGILAAVVVTLSGTQTLTNKTLTAPIIATISNTGTITLPTSTTTLVGRDTTDTLTSKTFGDPAIFAEYTVAGVPSASTYDNGVIIVSDETGGRTLATSDGTNWRRVSDGAIVS